MKIVILGLGAAGFGAAFTISRQYRDANVIILDEKGYLGHPCGLPFYLGGEIKDIDNLKQDIHLGSRVQLIKDRATGIDTKRKTVKTENEEVGYDKLIIATGSKPFIPIKVPEKFINNGVYTVSGIEDTTKLYEAATKGKSAVVVGAGAIGLETAIALAELGLNVKVIEMESSAFPMAIDKDVSDVLIKYLKKRGIEIEFEKRIESVNGKESLESVIIDGQEIKTDIVVMATGVRPNSGIAEAAGMEINRLGISVNDRMDASIKNVYAAGDCAANPIKLATSAYMQGIVAGANAAGGNLSYRGSLGTFVSVIGNMEVAATGYNSKTAKFNKYEFEAIQGANWFDGVKILADLDGKIIGAQSIGQGSAARINVIATAIRAGMSLEELYDIDYITKDGTVTIGKESDVAGRAKGPSVPDWYGKGEEVKVELYADSNSSKVTGAKLEGKGAAWRANALLIAIKKGMTLSDIAGLEFAYCPAVSNHYDVINSAAELGLRRIK